ncbi:MAG TPA: triacylglycerol lipase, partial [Spirochaetota bacterium]
MLWMILVLSIIGTLFIDLKFKLLVKKWPALILLLVLPHVVFLYKTALIFLPDPVPVIIYIFFLTGYFFIMLTFYTVRSKKIALDLRLRIMMGGRRIFLVSLAASLLQIPACIFIANNKSPLGITTGIAVADIITTSLIMIGFLWNGAIRIMLTSRRLGILKRVLFLLFAWVPGVNIIIGLWFCKIVKQEFIHEYNKIELQNTRASSQLCKTKYPLLLLHGIGFRDYKYLNYWGRIPAMLIQNGSTVYYGHQQAWGSIEGNAAEIRQKIISIMKETGCDKVNIIAHSKGGLDARYMISSLGMADHVATLTTISTPHRGSELVDVLGKLKESTYRKICARIDASFRKAGDASPDAYTSSKQLTPSYCAEFNEKNPDAKGVYYQSYASEMKKATSHGLLSVPFVIMKLAAGNNDGLVTTDSAKWGEFKGTFLSKTNRGISHGDQIDLMRQDYEGFN